jgi:DNA polymerase V
MNASLSFIRKSERSLPVANVVVLGQADTAAKRRHLPLFLSRISAGFPSPADDYVESRLSLDEHFVQHPEATFFLRVQGDSMVGAGIHDGDLLIVDKSLEPRHGSIVIAEVHGELTVKRLCRKNGAISLLAENPAYRAISICEESQLVIWGVVTEVVHTLR